MLMWWTCFLLWIRCQSASLGGGKEMRTPWSLKRLNRRPHRTCRPSRGNRLSTLWVYLSPSTIVLLLSNWLILACHVSSDTLHDVVCYRDQTKTKLRVFWLSLLILSQCQNCTEGSALCQTFTCPLLGMNTSAKIIVRARLWNGTMLEVRAPFSFETSPPHLITADLSHTRLSRINPTLALWHCFWSNISGLICYTRSSPSEYTIYFGLKFWLKQWLQVFGPLRQT